MQQLTPQVEEASTPQVSAAPDPAGPIFEELVTLLRGGTDAARLRAARELRDFGPCAIEPLVAALNDQNLQVRLAAAEGLGEVGDERAVQPLVKALRGLFPGASPRRYRTVGILAAITFPLAMISAGAIRLSELGLPPWAIGLLIALLLPFMPKLYAFAELFFGSSAYPDTSPCRVFADALAKIAERTRAPELRDALPALKEIAADALQQDRRTRAESRRAARKIEALTAQLDALPVIASAPEIEADSLPRPSDRPD